MQKGKLPLGKLTFFLLKFHNHIYMQLMQALSQLFFQYSIGFFLCSVAGADILYSRLFDFMGKRPHLGF